MILKIIEYCFYDTYDKICSRTVLCATYIAELSNVQKQFVIEILYMLKIILNDTE